MNLAPEPDIYVMQAPTPASPVVLPHLAGTLNAHYITHYADPVWSLAPLTENPSAQRLAIYWEGCPSGTLREELRVAAWTMINGQLRPTFLAARGTKRRARISAHEIIQATRRWFKLAEWLAEQNISTLAECDSSVLHRYGLHLLSLGGPTRPTALKGLMALTRLWAFDQLSSRPAGLGQPPWEITGIDDYLPAATSASGGENETEPLAEQTMGPLLIWAMRMIDDLSEDILAAASERARLISAAATTPSPAFGMQALHAYLDPLLAAGSPIPAATQNGKTVIAQSYIAGYAGASNSQVGRFNRDFNLGKIAAQRPGPCPLNTPVTGRITGKLWREAIDYNETPRLMRHLGTAAFIVCSYLTGMRPGEVLGLRSGCCPDPVPDGGMVGRHLIRSHEYKVAVDEDGNHQSAGVEREVPWVAIAPVVNAIRVLERMVPEGALLFDVRAHDRAPRESSTGSLRCGAVRLRIEDFVTWANAEASRHQLPNERIAEDPHGRIGTARFRRSLAWHIARRPNGLVALAIQYGHLRTVVSGNYASRGRGGIHELIDVETARAVADTVADLYDDLHRCEGVSGPAARRAIKAAAVAPRFAGTVITATTARKLLANEDAMLYDNPHSLLLCHYKRERALCHREGTKEAPRLDHCVPRCGNIVRTDGHAAQLRRRAEQLEKQAAHVPGPLGERLHKTAERLRGYADNHDRTRITLHNNPEDDGDPRS